jgi:hypothetical protein
MDLAAISFPPRLPVAFAEEVLRFARTLPS